MSYTINPNAKNKWARNAENTMDLSIETDASSVYLDNGRTLEQELGEGFMVSNVATIDSAMSKVVDGTLDGAYESGVMYGRSLVNLSNLHKSFNDATLGDYYVDTSLCETSKLKLGTPYTLVFYTTVHGGDHDIYSGFELGVGNELHGTNAHPKITTGHWGTLVKNGWSKMCVTFTDFLGYKYLSLRPIRCHAPESGKSIRFSIEGFILLEGDWSNKDLPFNDYFTGICDVKMPILRNVGKNLFDGSYEQDKYINEHGIISDSADWCATDFIRVRPNTTYTQNKNIPSSIVYFCFYNEDKQLISATQPINYNRTFTTPNNCHFIRTSWKYSIDGFDFQFEEGTETTTYEDHKTNILHTPEEVVLRSLPNGVCDTLNLNTGEYIQRIGEVIKNNATGFRLSTAGWENKSNVCTFENFKPEGMKVQEAKDKPTLNCDKIPSNTFTTQWSNSKGIESITQHGGGGIVLSITRNKLLIQDVDGLNTYLQSNPLTIQYELATPITTTIEPLSVLFAYENGHIVLESGFEGQSLLPTLEYSTVINRTGQIQSIANTIQKQEKQITKLEQMLIQNIIDLDYKNTLLTLKNEMEEML